MGTPNAPVTLGGMALVDGVYIRSANAWAIARADGSVETGVMKRSPVAKIRFAVVKHPKSPLTRVLVSGGRFLQRTVTTTEPRPDELAVGCRAVEACLARQRVLVTF